MKQANTWTVVAKVVVVGVVCAVVGTACVIWIKDRSAREKEWLQELFRESAAQFARHEPNVGCSTDELRRRARVIELLSNGVFDDEVMLFVAQVTPPSGYRYSPSSRDYPALIWFVVDELDQVAWVGYSDSNDANAFGTKLFTTSDYYRVSRFKDRPKLFWTMSLDCIRFQTGHNAELVEYMDEHGSRGYVQVKVDVHTWNCLLSNRGQLILRDQELNLLDRIRLTPLDDEAARNALEKLMLVGE